MPRRRSMRATALPLFAGLLLAGCALWPGSEAPRARTPVATAAPERVVLVSIDTLRADYVGCYGSNRARTPTLDALAARGVRFETAIAPTPLTLPSHTSLLTGLEPPLHGVHHNATFRLVEGTPTLAQHFAERGYATAAFVAAVVLDSRYGLDSGFEVYDDRMEFRRTTPGQGGHGERRADHVVDAALAWLDEAPDRFFLWLHLYDPHANYDPPPEYRPRSPRASPDPAAVGFMQAVAASVPPLYAGEIAFADAQLGRILDALSERWGDRDTLVVATSDHGESLGDHGEITHSHGVYDATQRVPLLMAGAGLPRGRVVTAPVRLVDVAPTLVSLADLRPLPGVAGVDLGPWLRGERDEPLDAYVETLTTYLDFGWSPILGVRTERYKYLRTTRPELYDLVEDPGETHNLADAQPARVAELDAALDRKLEGAGPLHPTLSASADERAQLEALGYVVASPSRELAELGWVGGPDPKDRKGAVVSMMQARSLLEAGRPEEALAALASVPEAGGWIAEVRADAARAAGDAAAAERHAREAVAAQPDRADAQLSLARALEAGGRADEAREAYERAVSLDPSGSDPLVALGRLAEARGDLEAAAGHYDRAVQAPTPSAEAALRLAALRFEEGRPSAARVLLRDAGDAPNAPADARVRAAWAEARSGYPTLALWRLGRAMERAPGDEELARARAEIHAQFGSLHFPD